jgi:hypothetical protein
MWKILDKEIYHKPTHKQTTTKTNIDQKHQNNNRKYCNNSSNNNFRILILTVFRLFNRITRIKTSHLSLNNKTNKPNNGFQSTQAAAEHVEELITKKENAKLGI